ncbi:MAG: SDR family NAD(P)-dependent oxidoreductase [Pseudomonadales bacterium]
MSDTKLRCVVTGGSNGLGKACVEALLRNEHQVTLCASSTDSGQRALTQLQAQFPNGDIDLAVGDFASLEQCSAVAQDLQARRPQIDLLLHCAGTVEPRYRKTADGLESTFAINHVAPWLLSQHLLPQLQAAPQAQILFITSALHAASWDEPFQQTVANYSGDLAYRQSKLANLLTAAELTQRLAATNVRVNAIHPGIVDTGLLDKLDAARAVVPAQVQSPPRPATITQRFRSTLRRLRKTWQGAPPASQPISPATAAADVLHVATAANLASVRGGYFVGRSIALAKPSANDLALARRLWEYTERLASA